MCAQLVGYNLTSRYNCQAWLDSVLVRSLLFYPVLLPVGLTSCSAPLLPSGCLQLLTYPTSNVRDDPSTVIQSPLSMPALYRRIAIWERRTVITIALGALWLTNIAFLIYGACLFATDMRQHFDPQLLLRSHSCEYIQSIPNTK